MVRKAAAVFSFVSIVLTGAGCKKQTAGETQWLSEFSTITTPISNASYTDDSVFAAADGSGNLYLSGEAGGSWKILKSSDGGANWTEESIGTGSNAYHTATDSAGNIFVAGGSGTSGMIKKRSATSGTWSTVYSGQIESGKLTYFHGIAVDGSDNIYVCGSATVTMLSPDGWPDMAVTKMVVLKSTNHGSTWNLVDSFALDDYGFTIAIGMYVAPTGEIYAYGRSVYSTRSQSVIRKSSDGGATWTRIYEDFGSNISGLLAWGSNLILSEDYMLPGGESTAARVRGTSDTFAHLTLLDNYAPTGATQIYTGKMQGDSTGHVYYPMRYYDADGLSHLVLRGTDGSGEWYTVDEYIGQTGESLYTSEVFINGSDVYNIGVLYSDTSNTTTWIMRKATLTSTETVTAESVGEGDDLISPIPSGAKRIYITAGTHDGRWGTTAASAIAAADSFCNSDSNKPLVNSGVTYKALLVNSTRRACSTANCTGGASENLNWVLAANQSYVSREGVALGTTNASGLFTSLSRGLLTNTTELAWSGLEAVENNWTTAPDEERCSNFTVNAGDVYGAVWTPRGTGLGEVYSQYTWALCDTQRHLICVEQ